ncbi:hypothetical protein S245_067683, partial [Arachis hypogaea]
VNAASIKDKFSKNKKTPPGTSHKSLTEEQKALLKKSTPSGYSISMPTLNQKKIEHNKRRIDRPSVSSHITSIRINHLRLHNLVISPIFLFC